MMSHTLWTDLRLAPNADPAHVIEDACLVVQANRIAWMGPRHDLPVQWQHPTYEHKLGNRWVTPGLIDCHTHLVYGDNRAQEFALRLAGASCVAADRFKSQSEKFFSKIKGARKQ